MCVYQLVICLCLCRIFLWTRVVHSNVVKFTPCQTLEGKKRQGQQRIRWLDSITDSMDMDLSKFRETVKNREDWCATVPGVTESDISEWLNNNNWRNSGPYVSGDVSKMLGAWKGLKYSSAIQWINGGICLQYKYIFFLSTWRLRWHWAWCLMD